MKKNFYAGTAGFLIVATLLSGCATYDARYAYPDARYETNTRYGERDVRYYGTDSHYRSPDARYEGWQTTRPFVTTDAFRATSTLTRWGGVGNRTPIAAERATIHHSITSSTIKSKTPQGLFWLEET